MMKLIPKRLNFADYTLAENNEYIKNEDSTQVMYNVSPAIV